MVKSRSKLPFNVPIVTCGSRPESWSCGRERLTSFRRTVSRPGLTFCNASLRVSLTTQATMPIIRKLRNRSNDRATGPGKKSMSLRREGLGVFISTRTLGTTPSSSPATSLADIHEGLEDLSIGEDVPWNSSGAADHHANSPLVVPSPGAPPLTDEAEALGLIMARSKRLPQNWYYSNNLIMVNEERSKRTMAPLSRRHELDLIARFHAEQMAEDEELFHLDPVDLNEAFDMPKRRLGANVSRGTSIKDIHRGMMVTRSEKNNILDRRYTHMGMGTARSSSGELYMCQIFLG